MNKIQIYLIVGVFLFSLYTLPYILFPPLVTAQTPAVPTPVDYHLPYPGILPDHPLYSLKRFRDFLLITFNRHPLKKVELYLLFSDKKIAMSSDLLDKRKFDLTVDTLRESQSDLLKSAGVLLSSSQKNILPEGLADKVELAAKKHQEVIKNIFTAITDLKKREKINQALQFNNQAISLIQSAK
ncbi:hypothetical protein A2153_02590 [Candidatus Gottesmanbacteria bacterium RBG_16_38_7b]|uniref:DUF5667 domain-containing protein n=1 Tax=Candidatus Gottesmanbacteria bacterium RBG_16_38_7b TaxID=1798372 RepID=A0A1F5YLB0_9BACT|nr:MAG: hypothetical protein A2153_02590 [Candidatus Gottesmanbacteria bacterium RBG_16_38_7b]